MSVKNKKPFGLEYLEEVPVPSNEVLGQVGEVPTYTFSYTPTPVGFVVTDRLLSDFLEISDIDK